jgi:hypothetical protein
MPVGVVMQSKASTSRWTSETWSAHAVMVAAHSDLHSREPREIFRHQDTYQILYPGFTLTLYIDQCESYYHNLMSPQPGCFIIADSDNEQARPVPRMVTMSFDEAHAYLEGDADIFAVPIPPQLYVWTERFVLENYFPEQRKKRKNNDWKQDGGRVIR